MAKSSTSFTKKTAKVVASMGGRARWAKVKKAKRRAHALMMLASRRDRRVVVRVAK